jgi:dephospho-CoA kinase
VRNIAIVGKMYAGKTTLANEFVNSHGYTRVMMAGPLKDLARRAYGEDIQKDKGYDVVNTYGGSGLRSGREILQGIGQSIKQVDRDIWLKIFVNDTQGGGPFVVDDVRFKFEADFLREHGWYIVKVEASKALRVERAIGLTGVEPTESELNHESEIEVDEIYTEYVHFGDTPRDKLPETVRLILALAK